GLDVDAQRWANARIDSLLDRRGAVPPERLDITRKRDRAAGISYELPLRIVERATVDICFVGLQRVLGLKVLEQSVSGTLTDPDVDGDTRANIAASLERVQSQLG